jgi:hypothetical protein
MNYLRELIERLSKALRPKTSPPQGSGVRSEASRHDSVESPALAESASPEASSSPLVAGEA